jgi:hypothetical protein
MMSSHYLASHCLAASWNRRIADDVASELRTYAGGEHPVVEEMRSFLAVKGCRELLARLRAARQKKASFEALASIAHEMRAYGLDRPAVAAVAFRAPSNDSPEWRDAAKHLQEFVLGVFAECGVRGRTAEQSFRVLTSMVRGFVLLEATEFLPEMSSTEAAYQHGVELFIAGLRTKCRGLKDHPP